MKHAEINRAFDDKVRRGIFTPVARFLTNSNTAEDRLQDAICQIWLMYHRYATEKEKILDDGILVHSCRQRAVGLGFLNHPPKYGFQAEAVTDERGNEKKRPVINNAEAPTIRRMFSLASSGAGALKIAEQMTKEGHVKRSGKQWSKQAVLDVLEDPAYRGQYVVNRIDYKHRRLRPQEEWITIPVDPIVPPERWDRVAALLAARSPKVTNPAVVSSLNRPGFTGDSVS